MAAGGKILYLYSLIAERGFLHKRCRRLVQALEQDYTVEQYYAILPDADHAGLAEESFRRQYLRESDFLRGNFEVLFIEHRLGVVSDSESEKVHASAVKRFRDAGGIVIFAPFEDEYLPKEDNDEFSPAYSAFLAAAGLPPVLLHHLSDGHSVPTYGRDRAHALPGGGLGEGFWIETTEHYLDEFVEAGMRPIFHGVTRIAVIAPMEVGGQGQILLAGDLDTTELVSPSGTGEPLFGLYDDSGAGCGVTITGGVGVDRVVKEAGASNLDFLRNLVEYLLAYQRERRNLLALPLPQQIRQVQERAERELVEAPNDLEELLPKWLDDIHRLVTSAFARQSATGQHKLDAEEFLQGVLLDCWSDLDDSSRKYLVSGEIYFRSLQTENELDFAGVSVEFCKVLEIELNSRVCDGFRSYLDSKGMLQEVVAQARKYQKRPPLLERLAPKPFKERSVSFGQMKDELLEASHSDLPLYTLFREYLRERSPEPDFWLASHRIPQQLDLVAHQYRNGAVHTAKLTCEVCEEWRTLFLGLGGTASLLCQVVATAPQ